jgi:ABC-type transporter Mla subunit MlaD
MKLERDDAKIGVLVLLALAVFAGFIFHRGLAAALRKETRYQVALESASDLSEGTEVQLQGLRVGQVKGIRLQRDGVNYRFLATLGLRTDIVLWRGTRAIVVAKPLGGAFVDLQLPDPALRVAALGEGATLEGGATASLATLLDDASHLIGNLDGALGEARTQFKARGAGVVLDHPQVARILASLEQALAEYRALASQARSLADHGQVSLKAADLDLAKLDHSLTKVQGLLDRHEADLDTALTHLAGTLTEGEALAKEARALLGRGGPELEEVLRALDRNLRSSEELLELLKAKPNRVVWGKPGQAEREAAAKRVQEAREGRK